MRYFIALLLLHSVKGVDVPRPQDMDQSTWAISLSFEPYAVISGDALFDYRTFGWHGQAISLTEQECEQYTNAVQGTWGGQANSGLWPNGCVTTGEQGGWNHYTVYNVNTGATNGFCKQIQDDSEWTTDGRNMYCLVKISPICWPAADCTTKYQQTECDGCINAPSEYWCTGDSSDWYAPQGACTWGSQPSGGGSSEGGTTEGGQQCDSITVPANGGQGDCDLSTGLAHDTTCTPTCDTGYTLSGLSSCNDGTFTSATCVADSGGGAGCTRDCVDILESYNAAGCCGGDGGDCSTDVAEYKACDCCNN